MLRIFWPNSQNFIPAKYDTFKEADIENNFITISIFSVGKTKYSPIILNHTFFCSEENVFFKDERSNRVLMKGTKTT